MRIIIITALVWGIVSSALGQCSALIDLNTWTQEGPAASGNWVVNGAGTQLTQTINGQPTFFVSPQDFINVRITGTIRVNTTGDDDFVGFVFGWQPIGTTGPNYTLDCMLFDWKQGNQTNAGYAAQQGKYLSRFDNLTLNLGSGAAVAPYFWGHVNTPPNFLAIDQDLGAGTGWADNTNYNFTLTYLSSRAIVQINGDTIFDEAGCYQPGRFGFYNYSQSQVIYSNFSYELIPDFTMASTNICLNDSAHFQFVVDSCANLNQANFPISNWYWDFGDGNTSTQVNPAHLYSSIGTYNVQLIIADSIGCSDSTIRVVQVDSIPPAPVIGSNSPLCDGDTLQLTTQPVTNATYSWAGPNGFSSTLQNPVINGATPAATGTYINTLYYGVCPGPPDSLSVTVFPLPPALAPTSNSPVCTDSSLQLNANTVAGATYTWSGPNGFTSSLQNPSLSNVTAANAGMYYVYATQNSCDGPVDSVNVVINATPVAVISGDSTICIGDNTTLLGSGGSTYLWSTTQTTSNITVGPVATQSYYLVASDADGCPSLPDSVSVVVSPLPTPNIGPDTASCNDYLLDAGAGYLSYLWSTGATAQTLNVTTSGLYWVEVMSVDSCLGRDSVNITINYPGGVSLGPDVSKCEWDSVQLVTTPAVFPAYNWTGGGTASTLMVNSPGTYSVTVTDANGCFSADTIVVSDYALLSGNMGNDTTVCNGGPLLLNAGSWAGATYNWNPGGPGGSTSSAPATGQYSVVIDDGNGCLFYDTINVVVDLPPTMTLVSNPTDICAGEQLVFTASPAGMAGYVFNVNGIANPNGTSNVLTIPNAQNTQIVGVIGVTAAGCTSAVSLPATGNVVPRPTGTVTTTTVCEGDPSTLTLATTVGMSVTWSGGDGLSGNGTPINYTYPSGAGTYPWSVVVDNGLCDTTITGTIDVKANPAPPVVADQLICQGDDGLLEVVPVAGGSYEWYSTATGGGLLGTGPSLTISNPAATGTYYVEVTVNGCTSTRGDGELTVSIPPVASFVSNPDAGIPMNLPNTEVTFTNLSNGAVAYSWDFGDGNTSNQTDPVYTYTEEGLYTVTLTAENADGCTDEFLLEPYVVENIQGLYIPNAFSPNGDGLNENFEISYMGYEGYQITIFDRWGKEVFDNGGNPQNLWNGRFGGKQLPEGVYVYRIIPIGYDGEKPARSGSVMIIR